MRAHAQPGAGNGQRPAQGESRMLRRARIARRPGRQVGGRPGPDSFGQRHGAISLSRRPRYFTPSRRPAVVRSSVCCSRIGWALAAEYFWPGRGVSDAHPLPGAERSEQRSPGRTDSPPGGLRRRGGSGVVAPQSQTPDGYAPSSRLARTAPAAQPMPTEVANSTLAPWTTTVGWPSS